MATKAIPEGFHTVTPTLVVEGANEAIALYTKAFGATEDYRVPGADGKVAHACLTVGNSKVFLADLCPQMGMSGPAKSAFYLYVQDVDATFVQAKKAGLSEKSAPQDMFWGDRTGTVTDKFGMIWTIATHVRDVSKDEMDKAMKQMANKAA